MKVGELNNTNIRPSDVLGVNKCEFEPFQKVLVRDEQYGDWGCDLFSHYEEDSDFPFVCIGNNHIQCLPFEGNEHILGTPMMPSDGCINVNKE